ncbi:MAG: HAD family hydrolase, partial [Ruminiclostridium sp.]|nr:HAD family hydrolase [Ruminiclostridium sp.]
MKITTIMFDLDGTLLPMDNDEFTKSYFSLITQAMTPHGYEPETLVKAIMTGITAMVKNDGTQSNEGAFWRDFSKIYGEKVFDDKPLFDEFYKTAFQNAKAACGCDPKAAAAVRKLKESGLRIVLATNPIFPRYAVESRIR